jgi:hypothetical protein
VTHTDPRAVNTQRPLTGPELRALAEPYDRLTHLPVVDVTAYPDGTVVERVVVLPRHVARHLLRDRL